MAKSRLINTSFWSDPFIQELDPTSKLLFLYFLTNEHTNICGIYEISLKTIIFETGINKDRILEAINRLAQKINYTDGWLFIKNFAKHQQNNPSIRKGIEVEKNRIPKHIIDRLYTDCDSLVHLNLNLNTNTKVSTHTQNRGELKSFGEEKSIKLSKEEYLKLRRMIGVKADYYIQEVENWKLKKTKNKYDNDYRGILTWINKDKQEGKLNAQASDLRPDDFEKKEDYENACLKLINQNQ